MAKAKLTDLKQTHGALAAPRTIEQLTGQDETYSVTDLDSYRQLIANMTDEEMQEHAVEVAGITPINNRSLLIDRLEAKFVSTVGRVAPIAAPSRMTKADQDFQRRFLGNQL